MSMSLNDGHFYSWRISHLVSWQTFFCTIGARGITALANSCKWSKLFHFIDADIQPHFIIFFVIFNILYFGRKAYTGDREIFVCSPTLIDHGEKERKVVWRDSCRGRRIVGLKRDGGECLCCFKRLAFLHRWWPLAKLIRWYIAKRKGAFPTTKRGYSQQLCRNRRMFPVFRT